MSEAAGHEYKTQQLVSGLLGRDSVSRRPDSEQREGEGR